MNRVDSNKVVMKIELKGDSFSPLLFIIMIDRIIRNTRKITRKISLLVQQIATSKSGQPLLPTT